MTDLGFVHKFVPGAKNAPTLLLLHGTGGDEEDLIPLGESLAPGAALLSLRGKVLESGMPRFFRRLAEGVFDQEDLKFRTDELAEFLAKVRGRYGDRFIAAGYSNGANIAASLMLRHPRVLAGAALFRAMVPFEPDAPADLKGIPVFLAAGRRDSIVAPQNTQALAQIFEASGAAVTMHWHQGGHELGADDIEAARRWLEPLL